MIKHSYYLFSMKIKHFDLPKYHFSLQLNISVHFVELKQKSLVFIYINI